MEKSAYKHYSTAACHRCVEVFTLNKRVSNTDAFEMCYRKLVKISDVDHVTNEVLERVDEKRAILGRFQGRIEDFNLGGMKRVAEGHWVRDPKGQERG